MLEGARVTAIKADALRAAEAVFTRRREWVEGRQ
jgi:hypothetical protein